MRTRISALCVWLLAALLAPLACASPNAPSPAWSDPGWRIIHKDTYVKLDAAGYADITFSFAYKAINEGGAEALIQQKFTYDPRRTDLDVQGLSTVKPDGRSIPVDPIATQDRTAETPGGDPFLDDLREKVVVFPDVRAGDIIRGRVIWRGRSSDLGGAYAEYWLNAVNAPGGLRTIVIDAPKDFGLRSVAVGADETVETRGDRIVRTVTFPPFTPAALTSAADAFDASPRYEVSSFPSYAEVAAFVRGKNALAAQPDAAIREQAAALVAGVADRRERIRRVYDWVSANIRYVEIKTEAGGFASISAARTFANRFGDCKAHVTLMQAMLRAIGEDAHMVLVNSGPRYRLTDLPMLDFDHAILFAPSVGLYLDATSHLTPFGAVPSRLADKPALDVETAALIRLPVATAADFEAQSVTRLDFKAAGEAYAHTTLSGEKLGEGLRRSFAEALEKGDARGKLIAMLNQSGHRGAGEFRFSDPRDLASAPYTVSADYQFNDGRNLDEPDARIALDTPTDWASSLDWTVFAGRRGVATTCSPIDYTEVVTATLPKGYSVEDLPPPSDFKEVARGGTALGDVAGEIAYHAKFEKQDDAVKLSTHATFQFTRGLCDAHVIDHVAAAVEKLDAYRHMRLAVTSPNVSPLRQVLRNVLFSFENR